jgi:GMP reductase
MDKYELIQVESIEEEKFDGTVYDFEVEDDHSYTIEGIVVHNSVCITREKTGFYRPMVSALWDCSSVAKVPLIADGGISFHGDINKAIASGAHMVMAGSLFAGYDESAGDIVEIDGKKYKEYYGSASETNKNERRHIEGRKILIDYKGPMDRLLNELVEDITSGISYAGGQFVRDLRDCEFYVIKS